MRLIEFVAIARVQRSPTGKRVHFRIGHKVWGIKTGTRGGSANALRHATTTFQGHIPSHVVNVAKMCRLRNAHAEHSPPPAVDLHFDRVRSFFFIFLLFTNRRRFKTHCMRHTILRQQVQWNPFRFSNRPHTKNQWNETKKPKPVADRANTLDLHSPNEFCFSFKHFYSFTGLVVGVFGWFGWFSDFEFRCNTCMFHTSWQLRARSRQNYTEFGVGCYCFCIGGDLSSFDWILLLYWVWNGAVYSVFRFFLSLSLLSVCD